MEKGGRWKVVGNVETSREWEGEEGEKCRNRSGIDGGDGRKKIGNRSLETCVRPSGMDLLGVW